ncbi:hypothetical protein ACFQ07_07160, partial [Actinomadura adrarensis]
PLVLSPGGLGAVLLEGRRLGLYEHGRRAITTELKGAEDIWFSRPHISHDGRFVMQGGTLWDASGGREDPLMHHATAGAECTGDTRFAFTSDNSALRCVGQDGLVRTLDVSDVTRAANPRGAPRFSQFAVSADRSTIAIGTSSGMIVRSVTDPSEQSEFRVTEAYSPAGALRRNEYVRLSADGRLL